MRSFATALFMVASVATALAVASPAEVDVALRERQFICTSSQGTMLVGDGDVRRRHYHIQLSPTLKCGPGKGTACAVSIENGETTTIEWSADASVYGWISGGFGVSRSFSTAEILECSGSPDDVVCIWQMIPHDEYTVQNYHANSCIEGGNKPIGDPFRMRSPLSKNNNQPYCVRGANNCRKKSDSYWAKN